MQPEINVTKTTRYSLTLTQEQVERILAEWARREHGMSGATVEFNVGYEYIRDISIVAEHVEETEEGE